MRLTDQRLEKLIKEPQIATPAEVREIARRLLQERDAIRIRQIDHSITDGVAEETLAITGPGGDYLTHIKETA